jgi:hypothetical protein
MPGGSAALARAVKTGDILLKVDGNPCLGVALERLRALVLGPQGSHVTMEFKRESRIGKNVLYFDVELVRGSPSFLKLLQRCHSLAQDSDRLKNLLSIEQVKCESQLAVNKELLARLQHAHHPACSDTLRVKDLQDELTDAKQANSILQHHLDGQMGKSRQLEQTLSMLQRAAAAQKQQLEQMLTLEQDRLAWVTEIEQRRVRERDMHQTIQHKLQGDVAAHVAAREKADSSLVQALVDSQLIRQEVAVLRMREGNVRGRLEVAISQQFLYGVSHKVSVYKHEYSTELTFENVCQAGHRALAHALSLNHELGLELSTLIPDHELSFHIAVSALQQAAAAAIPAPLPTPPADEPRPKGAVYMRGIDAQSASENDAAAPVGLRGASIQCHRVEVPIQCERVEMQVPGTSREIFEPGEGEWRVGGRWDKSAAASAGGGHSLTGASTEDVQNNDLMHQGNVNGVEGGVNPQGAASLHGASKDSASAQDDNASVLYAPVHANHRLHASVARSAQSTPAPRNTQPLGLGLATGDASTSRAALAMQPARPGAAVSSAALPHHGYASAVRGAADSGAAAAAKTDWEYSAEDPKRGRKFEDQAPEPRYDAPAHAAYEKRAVPAFELPPGLGVIILGP